MYSTQRLSQVPSFLIPVGVGVEHLSGNNSDLHVHCSMNVCLSGHHPHLTKITGKSTRGRRTLQARQHSLGTLLSVSIFNHERVPMYAYSNSLPANLQNYWTNNNVQLSRWPWNFKHTTLRTEKCHSECGVAIVSVATIAGYDAKSPFRHHAVFSLHATSAKSDGQCPARSTAWHMAV